MKPELNLSPAEKAILKSSKITINQLLTYAPDELAATLKASKARAVELGALIEFQQIPSLGLGFARELIDQGYTTLGDFKGKDPVKLYYDYEKHLGVWADPCVEDSYRLLVDYAENRNQAKRWWHFSAERNAYHSVYGYPADRPQKPWYDLPQHAKMKAFREAGLVSAT